MARRVWLEAALNGPWGRARQPGIPVRVEEIVAEGRAAAAAGAAIIHIHAYDEATGRQRDDWQIYARIIEGIQTHCDAIVYPTAPLAGSGYAADLADTRFAHTAELAKRGLIEWTVCDPGSVNFLRYDEAALPESGFIYENPMADIRACLGICAAQQLHPGFAIYEPGFTRLGAAMRQAAGNVPQPIYRFMFSDEFAWGFPPAEAYLAGHRRLLAETDNAAPWMVAGLGVDIRSLIGAAVVEGGHVRVGLEDAPWRTPLSNLQWVEDAVRLIRAAGGEPATPAEVRAALRNPSG